MENKKQKINFKYNLEVYWNFIKEYKPWIFFLIIITLITEGFFVVEKFLFKKIMDDGTNLVSGAITPEIFIKSMLIVAGIFILISFGETLGKWLNVNFIMKLNTEVIVDLKRHYFNHILGLSHSFHTTHKSGALISRMRRGADAAELMTEIIIFNFAPLIFQLIMVGISLAYFSIAPAIVILLITISFISYSFFIQQIQQKYKVIYNKAEDIEKGMIGDIFTNIDSVKYFGKEMNIRRKFSNVTERTKEASLKHWGFFRWFDAGQIFILALGTFFLIYFPLKSFLRGEMTIGTLTFIYTAYGNVVGPMFGFVWGMRGFYRSMADFQDLFEYGKIENEIQDNENARNLRIKEGKIEFKNVTFQYGKRTIFENLNLTINPEQKVAFVGPSGSGKSTLIKLLYRLYDINSGQILVDGKDIRNVKQESLRGEMGIVPQECILFDDTIYNNIKFSRPKASQESILNAIKFAQLDKIIERFPKKEQTIVGERGVKLSGGEKQRVSIARAILANKRILVLDEATSALDSETEHEIQKSLQKLLEGRTAIIIAHRLSTIMNADRIIVLKEGKIVQDGKHSELIRQEGEYRKLWNLQKGGYLR